VRDDGQLWRRYAYYEKDRTAVPVWICQLKKVPKGSKNKCKQHWVREESIINAYMDIIRELRVNKEFVNTLTENIISSIDKNLPLKIEEYEEKINEISKQIMDLMKSGIPQDKKQIELKRRNGKIHIQMRDRDTKNVT
jgi:hypothetical protein